MRLLLGEPMQDKYPTLPELKAALQEHVSYRCFYFDRKSWATIIAPHGGLIEAGTSALVASVAAGDYNLFDFQGLQVNNAQELHVSSTRFREPRLNRLLDRSQVALSIHKMGPQGEPVIWLGGLNRELKEIVLRNLRESGFAVNPDSPLYRGESKNNIVNLASLRGVQLELSDELMEQLFEGEAFVIDGHPVPTAMNLALVKALRVSLLEFEQALLSCA